MMEAIWQSSSEPLDPTASIDMTASAQPQTQATQSIEAKANSTDQDNNFFANSDGLETFSVITREGTSGDSDSCCCKNRKSQGACGLALLSSVSLLCFFLFYNSKNVFLHPNMSTTSEYMPIREGRCFSMCEPDDLSHRDDKLMKPIVVHTGISPTRFFLYLFPEEPTFRQGCQSFWILSKRGRRPSVDANPWEPLGTPANSCKLLQTSCKLLQPLRTPVNPCEPLRTPANPCELLQTPVNILQTPATPANPCNTPVNPLWTPCKFPAKTLRNPCKTPAKPLQTPANPCEPLLTPCEPPVNPCKPLWTPAIRLLLESLESGIGMKNWNMSLKVQPHLNFPPR